MALCQLTPMSHQSSDPVNKNSDTDARSTTKESPEKGNHDIPLETTFSKILLSAHKKKLFQTSTPIKNMDNIHRNFQDEGYNDEPVPRENIQLPSYSGDDNDNVDALEEKLRIYCKIKGISEIGKLDRIPFCLSGRAFTLFSGLSNAQKRDMGAITKGGHNFLGGLHKDLKSYCLLKKPNDYTGSRITSQRGRNSSTHKRRVNRFHSNRTTE